MCIYYMHYRTHVIIIKFLFKCLVFKAIEENLVANREKRIFNNQFNLNSFFQIFI
jgi:hypothetical protein